MHHVFVNSKSYLADDVEPELLAMRTGGVVSILPSRNLLKAGTLLYLGDDRGSILVPASMRAN